MVKNPIFRHLGPRYHFLTTRKVISGQKWYRNTNNLENSDFFAEKKFFFDIFHDFDLYLPDLGSQNSFFFFFLIFIVLGFALGSFCTIPHYPSSYNTVDTILDPSKMARKRIKMDKPPKKVPKRKRFFLFMVEFSFALGSFCTIPHFHRSYITVGMPKMHFLDMAQNRKSPKEGSKKSVF